MKLPAYLMIGVLTAIGSAQPAYAKPGKHAKHQHAGAARVVFVPSDLRVIKEYYGPRYRNLPPGLQKKYARTGQLPPGWQKKMEVFPVVVERQLVVLPAGYRRGIIDGYAVIYDSRHAIVDLVRLY